MKRIGSVALLLSLVAVSLSGCYVVPAPPPLPGGSQPSASASRDGDAAVPLELWLGLVRVGLVWRVLS